jgi:predicted RNase H-like HicB family nuclease
MGKDNAELRAKVEAALKLPYSRVFQKEESGGFSACILEFIGCYTDGDTVQEVWDNLEDAAESWLESLFEQGMPLPEPLDMYKAQKACRRP